jgi:hypothetical protein
MLFDCLIGVNLEQTNLIPDFQIFLHNTHQKAIGLTDAK